MEGRGERGEGRGETDDPPLVRDSLLDPLADAGDFAFADQRADGRVGQRRVADLQCRGGGGQALGQRPGDFAVGENPLHRNAHLPGMIEAAFRQQRQGVVEIGVGGHDHRRHAAVLQRASRAGGELRPQRPAHLSAADEAEKPDPRIGDHRPGQVLIDSHQRLAPLVGQAGFSQNAHQPEARQRRRLGRLDDRRAAGRDGRPDLMGNQVQRMVEGAEGQHHADRLVMGESQPPGGRGVAVHRDFAAGLGVQVLGAQPDAIDRPIRLDQRIHQRLSAFAGRLHRQLLCGAPGELRPPGGGFRSAARG